MKHFSLTVLILSFLINTACTENGKLLSKHPIDISKTPIWNKISINNQLKPIFKHLEKLNFYHITYQSDSLEVSGMMVEPKQEGEFPVVIFNRGGNRTLGQLKLSTLIMFAGELASQGYVVIGSNYRQNDEFGGADINDVINLIETLGEIEKVDSDQIGMFGWSRGGMMTYLALQKSNRIKTAIVGNGAVDLFNTTIFRPEMETNVFAECIPNYWENKEVELKKRSAIYWADELNKNSSLLILSGTNDQRVNPIQAKNMAKKLKEINYNFQFKEFNTDHFFSDKKKELNHEVIQWFNQELKNSKHQ